MRKTINRVKFDEAVDSLLEGEEGKAKEWHRGACEMAGRILFHAFGVGEGTAENALDIASKHGIVLW